MTGAVTATPNGPSGMAPCLGISLGLSSWLQVASTLPSLPFPGRTPPHCPSRWLGADTTIAPSQSEKSDDIEVPWLAQGLLSEGQSGSGAMALTTTACDKGRNMLVSCWA